MAAKLDVLSVELSAGVLLEAKSLVLASEGLYWTLSSFVEVPDGDGILRATLRGLAALVCLQKEVAWSFKVKVEPRILCCAKQPANACSCLLSRALPIKSLLIDHSVHVNLIRHASSL